MLMNTKNKKFELSSQFLAVMFIVLVDEKQ